MIDEPTKTLDRRCRRREDNPRLVSRQTYWIEFAAWASGQTSGPICTECAAVMPDAEFVGAFVCEECAPWSERRR